MAFGAGLEFAVTVILFVFLLFAICAYMVLIRDIWTPIVLLMARSLFTKPDSESSSPGAGDAGEQTLGDTVLLLIIIIISPFLLKRDLHALRYNCYLGFASISLLCASIAYRASQRIIAGNVDIKLWPDSLTDVLFAYPIPILAFMCHFNVIGVQSSLVDPTRARVRKVIDGSMLISGIITYALGLFGYIWGGSSTQGNILLCFDFADKVILLGRVGCGITIMLATSMITLPCRESMLSLGLFYTEWRDPKASDSIEPIVSSSTMYGAVNSSEDGEMKSASKGETVEAGTNVAWSNFVHFASTFFIVAVCYIGATVGAKCGHRLEYMWLYAGVSHCVYFTIACLCENPRRKEGALGCQGILLLALVWNQRHWVCLVYRPNHFEAVAVNMNHPPLLPPLLPPPSPLSTAATETLALLLGRSGLQHKMPPTALNLRDHLDLAARKSLFRSRYWAGFSACKVATSFFKRDTSSSRRCCSFAADAA